MIDRPIWQEIVVGVLITVVGGLILWRLTSHTSPEPTQEPPSSQLERITQLERFLQKHPGVYDRNVHNELRHLYVTTNLRRSMEHSDVILQHSPMDDYVLNILSGWQVDKDASTARANLLMNAQSFPDLRFVAAACFLKIGDLYSLEGNLREAKSSYLKMTQDKSSDMAQYRLLAEERLKRTTQELALGDPVRFDRETPDACRRAREELAVGCRARIVSLGVNRVAILASCDSTSTRIVSVGQTVKVIEQCPRGDRFCIRAERGGNLLGCALRAQLEPTGRANE